MAYEDIQTANQNLVKLKICEPFMKELSMVRKSELNRKLKVSTLDNQIKQPGLRVLNSKVPSTA